MRRSGSRALVVSGLLPRSRRGRRQQHIVERELLRRLLGFRGPRTFAGRGRLVLTGSWQPEPEARSPARLTLNLELAALQLEDPRGEREADAATTAGPGPGGTGAGMAGRSAATPGSDLRTLSTIGVVIGVIELVAILLFTLFFLALVEATSGWGEM
jgi:hypothetical protein